MNQLTGFQLVASQGLQQGGGLVSPNITANYASYKTLAPVSNYSNIYYLVSGLPSVIGMVANPVANVTANLSLNNINVVISITNGLSSIINDINNRGIAGIEATAHSGNLSITANAAANFQLVIDNTSNAFILSNLGLIAGSYTGTSSGITANSLIALTTIGANSFPQVFGQIPNDFSSNLGSGPLIDIVYSRTANWFAESPTANVYIQALGQAQAYATSAHSVLSSAATSQWPGGPANAATGGFSALSGSNTSDFFTVAQAVAQLGTLLLPSEPFSGFSNAGCFQQILDSGNNTIGNLHLNFFGKTIVDPTTGKTWTIGSELFNEIISNPIGMGADDTFLIAALNPLDALVGQVADAALTQLGDLDAVVTFFGIGTCASQVYKWTDCLNVSLMLGIPASTAMISALNLTNTTPLDAYQFIKALVSNIAGLTNMVSLASVGQTMQQLTPLSNAPLLTSLTTPVTSSGFSNLQASFGPGSGTYGNPTVDDILGSTNFNDALSNVIVGLQPLTTTSQWANIGSDTNSIYIALNGGSFPVTLSNGNVYYDINSLAIGGSATINQNAASLANIASTITDPTLFKTMNGLAETHNNSVTLTDTSIVNGKFVPINTQAIISNLLAEYQSFSGLYALIVSIFFQLATPSGTISMDVFPRPALVLKTPVMPNSISSFASVLSAMASISKSIPGADEFTGLSNVLNCVDTASITGQALIACVTEVQNAQILANSGLSSIQNLATNTANILPTAATGTNTIGGGILNG